MSSISKINPGDGIEYDIKDSNAQTKVMSSPINIRGTNFTRIDWYNISNKMFSRGRKFNTYYGWNVLR